MWRREQRRKKENGNALCRKPQSDTLYGAASEWLTCGSGRSYQIPQQSRMRYVAKKVARSSRRPCLIPSDYRGLAPPRALPKIRIPQNPRVAEQLVRRKISSTLSLGALQVKTSLDRYKEWIKATEKEVGAVT